MHVYPIFLSVVITLKDKPDQIHSILTNLTAILQNLVTDYEIVVVDNASTDDNIAVLKELTGADGLPNIQVYALTKEVDTDTAAWVGLENALGDFVVVFDPYFDDLSILAEMLGKAVSGCDVVFANNRHQPKQTIFYRIAKSFFYLFYQWLNDVNLAKDAPQYRVLSKRVINFILQHNQPAISYRHLPATAGFIKSYIDYDTPPTDNEPKKLGESIEKGVRLMVSTTRAPMRLVTFLSLFGAGANVIYSLYVVLVAIFFDDVAPGWVSMSLQMSGMFFLISLVLLVLGEYILHMASLSNEGPSYHVGQELTSVKMTRLDKLNIEEVTLPSKVGVLN